MAAIRLIIDHQSRRTARGPLPRAGTARLEQILRRGQRAGDFDRILPATWLTAAILGLAQTAAEQVAAGRLTTSKAGTMLVDSALRLCGAPGEPEQEQDYGTAGARR